MRNAETVLGIIRIAAGHWRAGCSERRTPGSGRGGWKSAHGATRQPPTLPRPLLRGVEQAHRSALAHHVHRTARLGSPVLINGTWYKWGALQLATEGITSVFAGL